MKRTLIILLLISAMKALGQPGPDRTSFSFNLYDKSGHVVSLHNFIQNYQRPGKYYRKMRHHQPLRQETNDSLITVSIESMGDFIAEFIHKDDTMALLLFNKDNRHAPYTIDSLVFKPGKYLIKNSSLKSINFNQAELDYYNYILSRVIITPGTNQKLIVVQKNSFTSIELNRLRTLYGIAPDDYKEKGHGDFAKMKKNASRPIPKARPPKEIKEKEQPKKEILHHYTNCSHPVFCFKKTTHDLGVIPEGENISYTFQFKNISKDTIDFWKWPPRVTAWAGTPGGPAVVKNYNSTIILPGEEGFVKIDFGENIGIHGKVVKSFYLSHKGEDVLSLFLKAYVEAPGAMMTENFKIPNHFPIARLESKEFTFKKVKVRTTLEKNITLTNVGDDTLKIYKYLHDGSVYLKIYDPKGAEINYILPAHSAILKIKYDPLYFDNQYEETVVTLITNAPFFKYLPILLKARYR